MAKKPGIEKYRYLKKVSIPNTIVYIPVCNNYIQQCSIVQLCIPRKLEAFCMPDVGGQRVISREFSRDVQLTNIARCM